MKTDTNLGMAARAGEHEYLLEGKALAVSSRSSQLMREWRLSSRNDDRQRLMAISNSVQEGVSEADRKKPVCDQRREGRQTRQSTSGRLLEYFAPGFYFDDKTVHVDIGQILRTYGIPDTPDIRAVSWSDIESEFGDVPLQELCDS